MFSPARLITGNYRWYISFYQVHPDSGQSILHRETWNLNRIKDLQERSRMARRIIRQLNDELLPAGYPYQREYKRLEHGISLREGIMTALDIKLQLPRKNTHKTYRSIARITLSWCESMNIDLMRLEDFGTREAFLMMDWVAHEKKVRERTYNNYLLSLKALWNELIKREYIQNNPWTKVERKREKKKLRRPLTDEEKNVLAATIRKTSIWLYFAILLQYYCFIRPAELRRLRFSDFDLDHGTIRIKEYQSKTWKSRIVTIPESILHYFRTVPFSGWPTHYYVFGRLLEPHGSQPVGDNTLNRLHRKIVNKLAADGRLHDVEGIHLYSWKDTGIKSHSRTVSPYRLRDAIGHHSLEVTMRYYEADPINPEMRKVPDDL